MAHSELGTSLHVGEPHRLENRRRPSYPEALQGADAAVRFPTNLLETLETLLMANRFENKNDAKL